MTETDMDEICKGCLSYERIGKLMIGYSSIRYGECPGYNAKDIGCPCQHCLIKVMCDVVCGSFRKRKMVRRRLVRERVNNGSCIIKEELL